MIDGQGVDGCQLGEGTGVQRAQILILANLGTVPC